MLTRLFLQYGYDVFANKNFNGYACLCRLCFSFYDPYILHVAELLLDFGACLLIDGCNDDEYYTLDDVLSDIEWKYGDWMTGEFYSANIFAAYHEMVIRKIQGKSYKGIRSFRNCAGETVHKVLRLSHKDSIPKPGAFNGALVFVTDTSALMAMPLCEFIINPYYEEYDFATEDMSDFFSEIIGAKIKGQRFESSTFGTINFDNGKSLSFMSSYYDPKKEHKSGLYFLRNSKEQLHPYIGLTVNEFLFTGGITFSDEVRVYELGEIFLHINDKYYHVYSKSSHSNSYSLRINQIPREWAPRMRGTIKDKNAQLIERVYWGEALKWLEFKSRDRCLYICGDISGKVQIFSSLTRLKDPAASSVFSFNKNLEKIDFISYKHRWN